MDNLLQLQVINSDYEHLPHEEEWSESIFYDSSFDRYFFFLHRFTEKRSITINSPSNTLHVSSLKKEICNENALFEIFSEYGEL